MPHGAEGLAKLLRGLDAGRVLNPGIEVEAEEVLSESVRGSRCVGLGEAARNHDSGNRPEKTEERKIKGPSGAAGPTEPGAVEHRPVDGFVFNQFLNASGELLERVGREPLGSHGRGKPKRRKIRVKALERFVR